MVISHPKGRVNDKAEVFRSTYNNFRDTIRQVADYKDLDCWNAIIRAPIDDWDADFKKVCDLMPPGTASFLKTHEAKLIQRCEEATSRGYSIVFGYEEIWATKDANLVLP